jgi:hypothetical protein
MQHPRPAGAESQEIVGMVGKRRPGRFTLKNERELIAMAANGATASEIAAKFKTSVNRFWGRPTAPVLSLGGRSRFCARVMRINAAIRLFTYDCPVRLQRC